MLRMGYSSEIILRDLNAKRFAGPLDPSSEAELRRLNASPALLDALKSGNYAASEEESAQARKGMRDAEVTAQKAADQEAADQKEPIAYREYLAQQDAAQKLEKRVKKVISNSFIPDSWVSPD
jgi:hypothetical protein